jgi:hypothetical protein
MIALKANNDLTFFTDGANSGKRFVTWPLVGWFENDEEKKNSEANYFSSPFLYFYKKWQSTADFRFQRCKHWDGKCPAWWSMMKKL